MDKKFSMKLLFNEVRISLIASTIFLILLQPLLGFIWSSLSSLSSDFAVQLVDKMYANASLGSRDWISLIILYSITGVLFFKAIKLPLDYIIKERSSKKVDAEIKTISETIPDPQKRLSYFEKKISRLDNSLRKIVIFYTIFVFLAGLSGLYILVSAFIDLQLNTSFNRRVNALSPYISSQNEEELKSKWALMENRRDWDAIQLSLDSLAVVNNAKLPENLLK